MQTAFSPLNLSERTRLQAALLANRAGAAITMSEKDTSFVGIEDDVTDEEVINAVKHCPTHY